MNASDYASQIQALAKRLDRLLDATLKLSQENQKLKQQLEHAHLEQQQLSGKNALARHRVESMLTRLNDLEQNHD